MSDLEQIGGGDALQRAIAECESAGVGGGGRGRFQRHIPKPKIHQPLEQILKRSQGWSIRDPRLKRVAESWTWGGGSLLLLGKTGVGKTCAALDIVRRLIAAEPPGQVRRLESMVYAHSTELAEPGWSTEARTFAQQCKTCRLLVLDDLGWDLAGPVKHNPIPGILHARSTLGLPTFVTSGETYETLTKAYSGAVVRRILFACEGGELVDCYEPDPEANDNKSRAVGS